MIALWVAQIAILLWFTLSLIIAMRMMDKAEYNSPRYRYFTQGHPFIFVFWPNALRKSPVEIKPTPEAIGQMVEQLGAPEVFFQGYLTFQDMVTYLQLQEGQYNPAIDPEVEDVPDAF